MSMCKKAFCLAIALLYCGTVACATDAPPATATPDAEARAHEYLAQSPPDWAAARAAFEAAAEAGSPSAMSYLGWLHEQGHGTPRDGARAAEWYARAANAGAHAFAVKLGWMYLGGDGVPRDRALAERWFLQAIEAGHVPARLAWASVLIADALGEQESEHVGEARALLESALEDGLTLAAYFLARLYIEGIGGHPVDDDMAIHYTRIGAQDGHARMQGWLAQMYMEGRGADQDLLTAAKWANLAAANGDNLGQQLRVALEADLTPAEIDAVRQRALAWALEHR
ncbi:MAG: tetratricopeptide repeat protein [Gammaproteobacteria bacterium]